MKAKVSRGARASRHEVTRANLRLDAEQYRRLLVFSVMENRPAGEIVSDLLAAHLKGWSMPGKVAARATQEVSVDSSGRARESEAVAA